MRLLHGKRPRRRAVTLRGRRHLRTIRLEPLEPRCLLAGGPVVQSVAPAENTHTAPLDTNISAVFDQTVAEDSVSSSTFVVRGMQSGQRFDLPSVDGDTVTLDPTMSFNSGEPVQVTLTTDIRNPQGEASTDPYVWQFRTAAVGGSGTFNGEDLGSHLSMGVALGDLNGDGDLDAFFATLMGPRVWFGDGQGRFDDTGQTLGNRENTDVELGDLDGDGDLDAFVTRAFGGAAANGVWLNDGQGMFVDSGQALGDSTSSHVALGDVDGDGDLDAWTAEGGWDNPRPNMLWLNDGNGVFSDSGQRLGNSHSEAVALGDLDGDGDLDAFVTNHMRSAPNKVWLNDGQGGYSDSGQSLGSSIGMGVALGDLDADGDLDAFVANSDDPNKVWINDGQAGFSDSGQSLGGDITSYAVALGDVDGDGDLDAFLGNWSSSANQVWRNDGQAGFSDSGQTLGEGNTESVALGDVDGDGDLDAVTVDVFRFIPDRVWLNQDAEDDRYEPNDAMAAARDLSSHRSAWLGAIDGPGMQADSDWYRIAVAPGDRRLIVSLAFAHADGDVNLQVVRPSGIVWTSAESTGDGEYINSVLPSGETWYLRVFGENTGNRYDLWWDAQYVHPGDANLDGITDVRDFNVWNAHKFTQGTDWRSGDFNGDGLTDVRDFNIWNAHKFTSTPEPSGLPEFDAAVNVQSLGADIQVDAYSVPSLVDYNADGRLDLLVGEKIQEDDLQYYGKVQVYLNTGTAAEPVFAAPFYVQFDGHDLTVPASGCLGVFPRMADWDRDGRQDLVLGRADGKVEVLLNENTNADPQFAARSFVQVGPPDAKTDVKVSARATPDIVDWNHDGRFDLVLGALDGKVRVLLNPADSGPPDFLGETIVTDGDSELVAPEIRASVAVYDLNRDGRKDLVLGNTAGQLAFYANVGTDSAPLFDGYELLAADSSVIDLPGSPRSRPYVGDYNADGIPDLLVGAADGLARLYLGQDTPAKRTAAEKAVDALLATYWQ